jgi:hypothetical protein
MNRSDFPRRSTAFTASCEPCLPVAGDGAQGAGDGAVAVTRPNVRRDRGRVDAATALNQMRALVASADPLVMVDRLTSVLVPAVCDAVKVDLFADGTAGGVRFQRSVADEAGGRTELTTDAPHLGNPSVDGASGPFVGPDRVTSRFTSGRLTPPVYRGFVVCRWDDGYGPNRADATLVQSLVDGAVLLMDRERLADQLRATTERADNLQRAVESNRRIGAAIGILVARSRLTEQQAFQELVRVSSITNTKLRIVADTVVRTGELPGDRRSSRHAHRSTGTVA